MNNRVNLKSIMLDRPKVAAKPSDIDRKLLRNLVFEVANLAEDKKGTDTEVLDITKVAADIADYIIIVSANNPAQLKAIAKHIEETLSERSMEPNHKEGKYGDKWFLLDYLDFVVHIIDESAREFYNLEELWHEAMFIPRDEWS